MSSTIAGSGPVTLQSLLEVDELRIEAVHLPEESRHRPIRWVTVTEMIDPAPYLLGDELILTLGSSWPDPESPDIAHFIERIASAGVTAVGITVGLQHEQIPPAMVNAAEHYGLPLLNIPLTVSFRQVGEYVVNQTIGDRYAAVRQALEAHESLTEALLSRLGLDGLLSQLRNLVEVPVAVIDYHGSIVSSQPSATGWPVEEIVAVRSESQYGTTVAGTVIYPITIAGQKAAFLCTLGRTEHPETIRFALGLVALELSRRQAERHGRRELIGQVIADFVQGDLADQEAHRRLSNAGIDLEIPHRVVLAKIECPPERLVDVPWSGDTFLPQHVGSYLVALVEDIVAVVIPESAPVEQLLEALTDQLGRMGPVRAGAGGLYPHAAGFRLSWLEAQEAMSQGPNAGPRLPMNLSRLMLANMKVPLRHVGEELLRSLLEYDRDHEASLIETLKAFVSNDCQTAAAAQALFVHRNTLRYRLQLIERLTNRNLNNFEDLVNLHLAVLALEMGGTD